MEPVEILLEGGPFDSHIVKGSGNVPVMMLSPPRVASLLDTSPHQARWDETAEFYVRVCGCGAEMDNHGCPYGH